MATEGMKADPRLAKVIELRAEGLLEWRTERRRLLQSNAWTLQELSAFLDADPDFFALYIDAEGSTDSKDRVWVERTGVGYSLYWVNSTFERIHHKNLEQYRESILSSATDPKFVQMYSTMINRVMGLKQDCGSRINIFPSDSESYQADTWNFPMEVRCLDGVVRLGCMQESILVDKNHPAQRELTYLNTMMRFQPVASFLFLLPTDLDLTDMAPLPADKKFELLCYNMIGEQRYGPNTLIKKDLFGITDDSASSSFKQAAFSRFMTEMMASSGASFAEDFRKQRIVAGEAETWWGRLSAIKTQDPVSGAAAVLIIEMDVTDLKKVEGELKAKDAIANAELLLNKANDEGARRVLMDLGLHVSKSIKEEKEDEDISDEEDGDDFPINHNEGADSQLVDLLESAEGLIFNAWALKERTDDKALSVLAMHLFHRHDLFLKFGLDKTKVAKFFSKVEAAYLPNPYHNATHACDVMQETHSLIQNVLKAYGLVDKVDILALLTGAAIHDLEHQGVTNDFLITTNHDWALEFNDQSPNEMHHLQAGFKLLGNDECNWWETLSLDDRKRARKIMIATVLATDMKQHFKFVSDFQAKVENGTAKEWAEKIGEVGLSKMGSGCTSRSESPRSSHSDSIPGSSKKDPVFRLKERLGRKLNDEQKLLIFSVMMKVADIAHLATKLEVHLKWVEGLGEEFFRQGDQEKNLGLPVSFLCDRDKPGVTKSQVGFFDFVALPLFRSWAGAFPESKALQDGIEANYEYWKGLAT